MMKKLVLPLCVFILGLAAAQLFFGVDVADLARGFWAFLADLLDGPG